MASNLTEYLSQLQDLTQKNLNILSTINDAFTTKSEHLTINVDENTSYVIPSFIAIENKLNSLC
jgi:DNA-binding SARP family transcriptional activator